MSHRRIVPLVLLFCALSACAPVQTQIVRPLAGVSYPPSQNVEVLDAPPARPYVQIGDVEATGEPGVVRAQVIAQIRSQAQQIGADAVVLKDVSRTAPAAPRLNPTTGMYETTGGQTIPAFTGIAIKFR